MGTSPAPRRILPFSVPVFGAGSPLPQAWLGSTNRAITDAHGQGHPSAPQLPQKLRVFLLVPVPLRSPSLEGRHQHGRTYDPMRNPIAKRPPNPLTFYQRNQFM